MKRKIYKNNTPFKDSLIYISIVTEDCLGLSAENVSNHININGPDAPMIVDVNYPKLKVKERVEITPRRLRGLITAGRAIERTTSKGVRMINFSRRDCKFIKYL